MVKKHETAKAESENQHVIEKAEAYYRLGNFYWARRMAYTLLKSSDCSKAILERARVVLAETRIDLPSLGIGVLSLLFTGTVAILSAY
jgi:hypothetical protein